MTETTEQRPTRRKVQPYNGIRTITQPLCPEFWTPRPRRSPSRCSQRGWRWTTPLTLRYRGGYETLTEVLYNASVYRDAAAKVLGVLAARNVTEQMQTQRQVVERLAELERFPRMTAGRELKMTELKKENADLKK
jgi:hypothetical protein